MLSSIHPLGERGRHNRWIVTVTAFTLGAIATAAMLGAVLGFMGELLLSHGASTASLVILGVAAAGAGALDLAGVSPPGPERQVNEHWIGRYRGWIYGGAFGAQLGLGIMTYIVTWTVPLTFVAELMTGSWVSGAAVGAVFGSGRSVSVLLAGRIRTPSELTSFHRIMAKLGPPVRRGSAYVTSIAGLIAVVGVLS